MCGGLGDREGNEGARDLDSNQDSGGRELNVFILKGDIVTVLSWGAQMTGVFSVMLFCHLVEISVTTARRTNFNTCHILLCVYKLT